MDSAQLPPVGSNSISSVFKIKNHYILTEKMRQAATSPIINICDIINKNQNSDTPVLRALLPEHRVNQYDEVSGSSVLFENDENKVLDMFVKDFKKSEDDTDYCKMVTFNNENHNHPQSVRNLNIKIRKKIWGTEHPNDYNVGEMLTAYDSFYMKEQVGTRNNKPIYGSRCIFYNSEDFVVIEIGSTYHKTVELEHYNRKTHISYKHTCSLEVIRLKLLNNDTCEEIIVDALTSVGKHNFIEERKYLWNYCIKLYYDLGNVFPNLHYGYAITSHKAQGSSYINTYVFEDNILGNTNGSSIEAKNQSLYVAVSRPRKKLVLLSKQNITKSNDSDNINDTSTRNVTFREISKKELLAELYLDDALIISYTFDEGVKTKKYIADMLLYKADCTEGKYVVKLKTDDNEIVEFKHSKK